jgi:CheY-like chemotaxis protein
MEGPSQSVFKVLLADDLEDDRILLKLALAHTSFIHIVGETSDGLETIAYLQGEGKYGDREKHPFPDLLLLDLKMPKRDGFEVLKWVREQKHLNLKVVVLSASMDRADIQRSYHLGADFYQAKPQVPEDRGSMLKALERYLVHSQKMSE